MDKQTRIVNFVGGPLDGQTLEVPTDQTTYKHEQPPTSDDILLGEVPVGFFPPMHEYVYVETPAASGTFAYAKQHHQ